jgi:hypothetical protein
MAHGSFLKIKEGLLKRLANTLSLFTYIYVYYVCSETGEVGE